MATKLSAEYFEQHLDHLSYSSISTFLNCPKQWYMNYVLGQRSEPTITLAFGTAMHTAVQTAVRQREKARAAIFDETFDALTGEYCAADIVKHKKIARVLLGADSTKEMVNWLRSQTEDGFDIEKELRFYVPGVPVPILGYIDILLGNGVPVDIKTSAWDWQDDRVVGDLQAKMYVYGLNALGISNTTDFIHAIMVKNTGNPRSYTLHSQHPDFRLEVELAVQSVWSGIVDNAWLDDTDVMDRTGCRWCTGCPEIP